MSNYNYAEKFGNKVVGESFNISIDHAAANGQIAAVLQNAALQEGIIVAAKPVTFIQELNRDYLQQGTKAPDAKTIKVIQALHALALALKDSGQVKALPELNSLPDWACPAAIAAKAAEAKAKREATKAKKAADAKKADAKAKADAKKAEEEAKAKAKTTLITAPAVPDFESLLRIIRHEEYTAKELDQLQNALDFAKSKAQGPVVA